MAMRAGQIHRTYTSARLRGDVLDELARDVRIETELIQEA